MGKACERERKLSEAVDKMNQFICSKSFGLSLFTMMFLRNSCKLGYIIELSFLFFRRLRSYHDLSGIFLGGLCQ